MPLLKPCTVDGVLHTAVAPVQTVTWSAIPTPSGTLFGSSGASAYSTARSVRCSITLLQEMRNTLHDTQSERREMTFCSHQKPRPSLCMSCTSSAAPNIGKNIPMTTTP
jgi:hypothetical protein